MSQVIKKINVDTNLVSLCIANMDTRYDRYKDHVAMMGLARGNETKREPEMPGNPISFVLFFSSPSVNRGIFTQNDDQNPPRNPKNHH